MFKRLAIFLLAVMFVVESGRLWESCIQRQTVDAATLNLIGVATPTGTAAKTALRPAIETIPMDDVLRNLVFAYPVQAEPAAAAYLQVRWAVYDFGVANTPM